MLKVNQLYGLKVYVPKVKKAKKGETGSTVKYSKLGKVHMAVFSPDGSRVVGFLVRRPDVVGMVKRDDAFLAWDSFAMADGVLRVTREDAPLDEPARKRLGINWDACIMWAGMDAKTISGKQMGYVSDAEYDEKTGAVSKFYVGDGGVSRAIVGSFEVPPSMVKGYSNGYMILSDEATKLQLDGGFAAKAGEGYAAAKVKGAEIGKKAGAAASDAVDKGSFALGRALGKAKRAIEEATAEEEAQPVPAQIELTDVQVSEPIMPLNASQDERDAEEIPTYSPKEQEPAAAKPATTAKPKAATTTAAKPAAKKPAAKKSATTGEAAAKAVGKQLGSMGKMFSSFKEEFDKASK